MPKNFAQRLKRLEHNRQILRRQGGVVILEDSEDLATWLATQPVGQYLVIDAPDEDDYRLARGPMA